MAGTRRRWIAIARGDEPADLVLTGGTVLSVFTGELFPANVAIADGHVVGVGDYRGPAEYDVTGKILTPGFLDGHCHIESTVLNVDEFARAILPSGTTSVVVDPHELANVLGVAGVEYVLAASKGLPLGVYVRIPSCVPASPLETPAQALEACDYADLMERRRVLGLAEMMNYPAVIAGEPEVLSKMALSDFRSVDGHAPGVLGRDLNAYIVSGPSSDHECTTLEEALEKRRLGMWIMIREASMMRNLLPLLPMLQDYGTENCMFVTDDRDAATLLNEGHVNSIVRKAVRHGLKPADAVKLATLNVARYHGLHDRGAIAPGYAADILVLPDLEEFRPEAVFKDGQLVVQHGEVVPSAASPVPSSVTHSVRIKPVTPQDFVIPDQGEERIHVVELIPDEVVTRAACDVPTRQDGALVADPARDLLKLAVIERHHATGQIGRGFVRGFGLQRGAFASSVAHDAHNLIVAGVSDADMAVCANRLAELGGGMLVVHAGQVLAELPLEIAGLMSTQPAAEVAHTIAVLENALQRLGATMPTPFMYLSFLALSVIPELRITDQGVVDVRLFQVVPLGISAHVPSNSFPP